jgi:hypothetical protein
VQYRDAPMVDAIIVAPLGSASSSSSSSSDDDEVESENIVGTLT